ncbi:MAG TPA: metal-dependent hydrolase [Steroidobacteraceae bacterium]|nr:metal-dependent hydrolase [Steroidobacteraceae bacterium]
MDSLTHIAVGSAIGMAVMGARTPRWKAALWGSICATLPDLDTFIRHGDPIRDVTFHRGASHSLLYLTLLAPLIGWVISRIHRQPAMFRRWWLLAWLVLIFHPLLDVMTIYGTQLALPFTDYPFGVGSIFIIDPLFTLPVLIGAAVALSWRSPRALRWNAGGMAVSAAYLAWTFAAQQYVTGIARESLRAQGIEVERMEVDPTALNSVLWRITAMTPTSYVEGFYSLFDGTRQITFREHPRGIELYEKLRGNWNVDRMAWFTHGFFKMEQRDGVVTISDLRLGMEPYYGFTFAVFVEHDGRLEPITPRRSATTVPPDGGRRSALAWLWRRLKGERLPPLQ